MKFKKILKTVFNKYLICLVAVGVWLTFFDRNDMFTQYNLFQQVQKLKHTRDACQQEIADNKKIINDLRTNEDALEKFAREQHLMKKADEEVFVISNK